MSEGRRQYMQACESCCWPIECPCGCWTCTNARRLYRADLPAFVAQIQEQFVPNGERWRIRED